MSLLLYGIVAEQAQFNLPQGLRLIAAQQLAAIVESVDPDLNREIELVLAYGQQLLTIHQQTTLIPMRYGSLISDDQALTLHLSEHATHYQRLLIELDDCEEIGIRLMLDEPPAQQTTTSLTQGSGRDYLLARKQTYTIPSHILQLSNELQTLLSGLYRQHGAELSLFNGRRSYLLSYLVPRSQTAAFQAKLQALTNSVIQAGSISGPWPPYSFANPSLNNV